MQQIDDAGRRADQVNRVGLTVDAKISIKGTKWEKNTQRQ